MLDQDNEHDDIGIGPELRVLSNHVLLVATCTLLGVSVVTTEHDYCTVHRNANNGYHFHNVHPRSNPARTFTFALSRVFSDRQNT